MNQIQRSARAIAVVAVLIATQASSAAVWEKPAFARLIGTWELASPHVSCRVTFSVEPNGMATLQEGSQVTTWKIQLSALLQDKTWKISHQLHARKGASDCEFPRYVPQGLDAATYVRFLSEDRRMALCTTDNIGGCSRWFDRVGPRQAVQVATRVIVLERAIYRAVSEQPDLFELVEKDPLPILIIGPEPAEDFQQVLCPSLATWDVGGSFKGGLGELRIALCSDGKRFEKISDDAIASKRVAGALKTTTSADERLRYGISATNESRLDGAHMSYFPSALGVGTQLNTVIWVASRAERAVVVQLIGEGSCEARQPYADSQLCKDRAAALQAIAIEVAKATATRQH